jgi:hypothetical protein
MTYTAAQQQALLSTYEAAVEAHRTARAEYVSVADPTPFPALPPGALVPDGLPVLARLDEAEREAEQAWLHSLG